MFIYFTIDYKWLTFWLITFFGFAARVPSHKQKGEKRPVWKKKVNFCFLFLSLYSDVTYFFHHRNGRSFPHKRSNFHLERTLETGCCLVWQPSSSYCDCCRTKINESQWLLLDLLMGDLRLIKLMLFMLFVTRFVEFNKTQPKASSQLKSKNASFVSEVAPKTYTEHQNMETNPRWSPETTSVTSEKRQWLFCLLVL